MKFSLDGKTHRMKIPLLAHNTVKIDGGHPYSTNLLICGVNTWFIAMSLYWLAVHKTTSTYPELFGIYSHLWSIKYFCSCAISLNIACDQIYIPQQKLGDILEYHPSNISQFLNFMITLISLPFQFNSRLERVLWLSQKKGNLFLFIELYQRTLQRKHPTLHTVSCSQTFFHMCCKLVEG